MNSDEINRLEELTGITCGAVHDPDRQTCGAGSVPIGRSRLLVTLSRKRGAWRLVVIAHAPHAADFKAIDAYLHSVRSGVESLGTQ